MEIENFERAIYLKEQIDSFHLQKNKIEKMNERKDDKEFMDVRKIAHNALFFCIQKLEDEFNKL